MQRRAKAMAKMTPMTTRGVPSTARRKPLRGGLRGPRPMRRKRRTAGRPPARKPLSSLPKKMFRKGREFRLLHRLRHLLGAINREVLRPVPRLLRSPREETSVVAVWPRCRRYRLCCPTRRTLRVRRLLPEKGIAMPRARTVGTRAIHRRASKPLKVERHVLPQHLTFAVLPMFLYNNRRRPRVRQRPRAFNVGRKPALPGGVIHISHRAMLARGPKSADR